MGGSEHIHLEKLFKPNGKRFETALSAIKRQTKPGGCKSSPERLERWRVELGRKREPNVVREQVEQVKK